MRSLLFRILSVGLSLALVVFWSSFSMAQPGGGDRGGRGERGGFGGGAPGGGFDGRGGGDRGGFGGSRGGFDPSAMISRLDRNGNGTIDPEENTGFAAAMISRLAQRDPSIDTSKPIPISKLSASVSAAAASRGGGDRGGPPSSAPASSEPELLVPDFSPDVEPAMPEGFGAINDALFSVKVEDRDIKEGEERIRRYDRNKDGKLSAEELRAGRWSDNPMQYDRNKDGMLTATELASRYANRRVAEEERRQQYSGRGGSSWGRGNSTSGSPWSRGGGNDGWSKSGDKDKKKKEERFGDAKSYRFTEDGGSSRAELPSFLARMDKNGDNQVMMAEFSQKWNASTLKEFLKWDLNNDGVIIASESNAALNSGARVNDDVISSASRSSSGSSSGSSRSSRGSSSPAPRTTKPSGVAKSNAADPEVIAWAEKMIKKYDKNGDGELTKDEQSKMFIKPPPEADANGDGVLNVQEYAQFRANSRK
ncbi:MAG: EF-hand domain-containing protein [Planctomycetota bacterium]|nr:EF-hand domain-containing protein [Planctomycetota bacterium]